MTKVFRLFEDKSLQHWGDRGEAYGPSVIEQIPNPDGDFSKKEPTSIPSPFARIDLVRTAFKYVVDKNQLDGNTIYHKLISDCLDVGEMFFKIDSLGPKAQINSWDKNVDLNKLKTSNNHHHNLLGETLELYLRQDKETYNFDQVDKLFFLWYDHQIIGGTSPSTLFFTSANDDLIQDVCREINFGNYKPFDGRNTPLYKRDPDYQKYLYHFVKANPELSRRMRDLSDYFDKNLVQLRSFNNEIHNEIQSLSGKSVDVLKQELDSMYHPLDTKVAGDNLEIIGCWLKKKKIANRGQIIEENSDFVIKSKKYTKGYRPLVLQNRFAKRLKYTDSNVLWDSNVQVPFYNSEADLNNRTLPGQLDKYPYLTVSDFLQPYIIRLAYPINKEKYFDGNISFENNGDKTKHFIIPLTVRFFDFFDSSDLMNNMPDGKPMFEIIGYHGSVNVILRIPINANSQYITFTRTYDNKGLTNSGSPDISNNKGHILENTFSLLVYPFLKTYKGDAFYRVMLLDRDITSETKHLNYDLSFYKNQNNEKVIEKSKRNRSNKNLDNVPASTTYFILEDSFDYIEVKHNEASGIILPLFKEVGTGTDSYTFAIDFGTTNTHIEYKIGEKGNPKPFEITSEDIQYATLFSPDIKDESSLYTSANIMNLIIPHEFLPELINRESEYKFPIRTVLGEKRKLNLSEPTYTLADFNISFNYQKYPTFVNAKNTTNLKWSNYTINDDDRIRIERFFEKLMFLIRTKILLNNGDLDKTKLLWFYPSSMLNVRLNSLERIWLELFKKYITDTSNPIKLSESIAPFYYFKNRLGADASDLPVASVDIGGGTTDIVVYHHNKPVLLTSFRFAANSIFGDAYNGSPEINGFVKKYEPIINKLLDNNDLTDLKKVFDEIKHDQNSSDIITFLFSLENNKTIKERNIRLSFNEKLMLDDDLRVVFVIFYSAIIYHLAKLMKSNGMKSPRYLTFSGTGSKVISITDNSTDLGLLQKYTRLIFERVYATETVGDIEIKQYPEPKEITCKGGLLNDKDLSIDLDDIKGVLLGDGNDTSVTKNNLNYKDIDERKKLDIVNEIESFIDLVFSLHDGFNFKKNFGINPAYINDYKSILKQDLMQYLKSGLELKNQELSGDFNSRIEETLFFYPLVGALNRLAFKIVTQINKKSNES